MSKVLPVLYEGKPCYNIHFEHDFSSLSSFLSEELSNTERKVCIVTDSNVAKLYLDEVSEICKNIFPAVISYIFVAGEASKNLSTIEKLYEHLINNHFGRGDLLIALGGGVVGDMTGYAAATYLRGIDFVQIPTTLLSQVDSSVGGKTGVDFQQYKNMVGAFHMPKMVYMNTSLLHSLDDVQFQSGMGEVIKSGLIQNQEFYYWLKNNYQQIVSLQDDILEKMIFESCKIKKYVVETDPMEQGIRAYLNFGHTIGHAVEKLSDFSLYHGQCVAIGMVGAAFLSLKRGGITQSEYEDIIETISSFLLPVYASGFESVSVREAMKSDKKTVGDKIKFVILNKIGEASIDTDFTNEELLEAISVILK